jgi:hypothetical protein
MTTIAFTIVVASLISSAINDYRHAEKASENLVPQA